MKPTKTDSDFIKLAIKQAQESVDRGGFPAGAVVVKDGKVIAKGLSLGFQLNDPTGHAETDAIRKSQWCGDICLASTMSDVLFGYQLGGYFQNCLRVQENQGNGYKTLL